MRVARCRPHPTDVPQGQAGSELGKRRGGPHVLSPPVAIDAVRALGEVLEEVELLGGGNLAAITNEPALATLLQVNMGIAESCFCVTFDGVCNFWSGVFVCRQVLTLRDDASSICSGKCLRICDTLLEAKNSGSFFPEESSRKNNG